MNYTTDTHSLIWYFVEDSRLSKVALRAFEETAEEGNLIIPAVVLAEIMFIARKGRITLTFKQTLVEIETYENFVVAPLDIDILEIADTIKPDLEMHDKIIVATSLFFNAPLITKDKRIRETGIIKTIW